MTFWDLVSKGWENHGTKILGTGTAALSTVAALAAAGALPVSAPTVTWILVANAVLGGGTIARGFTNGAPASVISTPKQSGFAHLGFLAVVCISVLLALAASGCASFSQNISTEKLVVQVATLKVIEVGKTPDDQRDRATRIKAIASEARSLLDGEGVTIDSLQAAVGARIAKLNLQPSDQLLANALVEAVVAELQARIGSQVGAGVIPADAKYQVSTVLGWVLDAVAAYV